jgi:hypothetical protein
MIRIGKISSLLLVVCITITTYAQEQPVKWNFVAKKIADKKYELHMMATIAPGWHIYSSNQPKDAIGMPTSIKIITNPLLVFPGNPEERGTLEKVKNEELETEEHQYSEKVDFVQLVNVKANVKTNIAGSIEFMACTNERCLPPETINFRLMLQ